MVLCRRLTALSLREIGQCCGGLDYAAVGQAHHRMERKLATHRSLARIADRLTARLRNVKC
jgi:chromosomal replication initiation ATPase DnaA